MLSLKNTEFYPPNVSAVLGATLKPVAFVGPGILGILGIISVKPTIGVHHQQEAGTKQEWLMLLFFLGLGIVDHSPKSVTIAIYISYTCYQNCYRHMICYIPLGGFKDCLLSTTIGGLETTKRN